MEFYASIFVGISQAFIFNPIDKAIYTSIINNNSIFNRSNWTKPFSGALNGIYIKIITGGIYFYLIDYTKSLNMNVYQSSIFISSITSLILNPFNVVRFNSFVDNSSSLVSFKKIYERNKLSFLRTGLEAFIMRDFIFNLIYLNYKSEKTNSIYNCGVICAASVISSPFHYLRNIKYYNNDKSYYNIYKDFMKEIKIANKKTSLVCQKFSIGLGTARTICSIYYGQAMFTSLKQFIS
jgi:hypothetical protein